MKKPNLFILQHLRLIELLHDYETFDLFQCNHLYQRYQCVNLNYELLEEIS